MQIVTLQAHFDGKQILLDEPYELAPNTKLVVSVIEIKNEERDDWTRFSLANLERAFGDDEPEYSSDLIKEANPKYEGRRCRPYCTAASRRQREKSSDNYYS